MVRRAPRPLLTQAGAEQGALFGRTGGNFLPMQQQGLFAGNMPLPMPAIIAPSNIPPFVPAGERSRKGASISAQVARVLPSRPIRTLRPGLVAEVNISPKINISSRPLKMALHGTPGTPCPWIVIFLHGPKKGNFSAHGSNISART